MGHHWPVAPAYRVIPPSTWDARVHSVAWLTTSGDPNAHWCGPWYASLTGQALASAPGLMAYCGGIGLKFNPFDLYVMGLMGYAESSTHTYYVEAPPGPGRPVTTTIQRLPDH